MSKKKQFDAEAKSRIARATTIKNGGKIPKDSFATKVQSEVDRKASKN